MEIGKFNVLQVARVTPYGLCLRDEAGEEVLLPKRYVTDAMQPGTLGKVFVYMDNEKRPIATTLKPLCTVGEVAVLRVKQVNQTGAFLDWGLDKDLLLPYRLQTKPIYEDDMVPVHVFIDPTSGRIVASMYLKNVLTTEPPSFQKNEPVEAVLIEETTTGYKVVVNHKYRGLLYKNEIFEPVEIGDKRTVYVKKVREDGKVDVALQPQGFQAAAEGQTEKLILKLLQTKGKLMLSDSSSPEEIQEVLGMSKKNFKRAIGMLYKKGVIEIHDKYIKIVVR